ncbi:co-chaperone GroES [uncultured Winogradskyella sp.]|uniref:co-chaperone GroES n=1 Tax=uncultured Winogradskyella sp. TaxID=395353 RepID=UPI002613C057|nr:co-chaperone GroES [uncultured Winogradskyella sp.]
MALNIKPLADRVVIKQLPAETKTASGLIIPDSALEKQNKGKIVAIGPGKKDEPLTVKVGETVLYGFGATKIKVAGEEYLIIREEEILAII